MSKDDKTTEEKNERYEEAMLRFASGNPTREDAVVRLCHLQEEVSRAAFNGERPNDCFCGFGGFGPESTYRSVGSVIALIENLARAELPFLMATKPTRYDFLENISKTQVDLAERANLIHQHTLRLKDRVTESERAEESIKLQQKAADAYDRAMICLPERP